MSTAERIGPIVESTYGHHAMSEGLVAELARMIDGFPDADGDRGLEQRLMLECWKWFSGGTTAASVAARIMDVLPPEHEPSSRGAGLVGGETA